jgi:hypothetical protein
MISEFLSFIFLIESVSVEKITIEKYSLDERGEVDEELRAVDHPFKGEPVLRPKQGQLGPRALPEVNLEDTVAKFLLL